jgi:TetR/AcrR family transcriptional regulator, regulator of cefoperazone and chloramphenicol sensitivity
MTTSRTDGLETRHKLLDAAGMLFAERGFHDTKTGDICQVAEANIAAVHYHFRSKEDIYVAAWRHEFERSIATYPPDGGVPSDAPAEDRLRGHIQALVRRAMDPTSRDLDIAHREMSNPTGLLAEVMQRSIEPLRHMHLGIIREILGADATEQDVQLCEMSIHAQCIVSLMHERQRRLAPQNARHAPPSLQGVDEAALTEHILRFSLAGLREVRKTASQFRRDAKGSRKKGKSQ